MTLASNLHQVRARVLRAAQDAGRGDDSIMLIAVSKWVAQAKIREAIEAGHKDFGENRLQEAMDKWQPLKKEYPDVRLHFIGALQKNKLRKIMTLFDVIHSIDKISLAEQIVRLRDELGICPDLLLQVNVGDEPQKAGMSFDDLPAIVTFMRGHQLPLCGLMCIPPAGEAAAPYFERVRKAAHDYSLPYVSMGMSADFTEAIAHGATHIRVGTAIFGARQP